MVHYRLRRECLTVNCIRLLGGVRVVYTRFIKLSSVLSAQFDKSLYISLRSQ